MKLTVVFLLVALASYSCSPSAACEVLHDFVEALLYAPDDQYLEYINRLSGFDPPVKRAALELKSCAESLSPERKEAKQAVMENIIKHCEKQE